MLGFSMIIPYMFRRTVANLYPKRQGIYTSQKWNLWMWATTPVLSQTQKQSKVYRAHPHRLCSVVMVGGFFKFYIQCEYDNDMFWKKKIVAI